MNKWITLGLVASVALGCSPPAAESEGEATERKPLVRTLALEAREVIDEINLPADLKPWRRSVIAAEVSGVVEALYVDAGEAVKKGQSLAAVDRRGLEQGVAEAAAVALQREKQFERAKNLFDKRSITQSQFLDAITNQDVAKARLATAKLQLEKSEIKAPWSGRVALRLVDHGDFVAVGMPLFELVDVSRVRVQSPVAASDVPFVSEGALVELVLEAWPEKSHEGQLDSIAPTLDPDSRTLKVEAVLENPDGLLKPGLPARLRMVRRKWAAVITVPMGSLVDFGGKEVAYVVEAGVAKRREVKLGPVIGEKVVILEGLNPGDHLVTSGQSLISDDQPVDEQDAS